jgi:hypothetical protein
VAAAAAAAGARCPASTSSIVSVDGLQDMRCEYWWLVYIALQSKQLQITRCAVTIAVAEYRMNHPAMVRFFYGQHGWPAGHVVNVGDEYTCALQSNKSQTDRCAATFVMAECRL